MATIPGQPMPISGDKLSHSPHVGEHNQRFLPNPPQFSTSKILKMKVLLVRLHPKFEIFN